MKKEVYKAWSDKQNYFAEKVATKTVGIFSNADQLMTGYINNYLQSKNISSILDIGSGQAHIPPYIPERLHHAYKGIDPLEIKRSYPCFVQSLANTELSPQSYDCIICVSTIDHIADPEILPLKVKSWLKPDGLFLLSFSHYPKSNYKKYITRGIYEEADKNHVWHFNIKDIKMLFDYEQRQFKHIEKRQFLMIVRNV